jgi:hypothetical protein
MSLGTTTVKTSSATTFYGKTCGELKNGDAVAVAGAKQTDGAVVATTVYVTK